MNITIDNLDGLGPLDYTHAVPAKAKGGSSLTVQRELNAPSRCTVEIALGLEGLVLPVRHARVVVSAEDGTLLFTGYIATEPVHIYAGETTAGAVYRARVTAVSDEWLLDKLGSGTAAAIGETAERSPVLLPLSANKLLTTLTERVQAAGSAGISVASGGPTAAIGAFAAKPSAPWSTNAGAAASAAYAGYRAMDGVVTLAPAASVTHTLSDADGTLNVAELTTANVRELANDVTVSGEEEPAAYITECFEGDGATTVFELSQAAFRDGGAARSLLRDNFNQAAIDAAQWSVSDPGSHVSLTSSGLTLSGGTGVDGQTTVTALDAVEMGGSIVAQLGGVKLAVASAGMLAAFYEGTSVLANCFAGFRVRQSAGVTVIVPVVNGAEVGTVFTPTAGHSYTLRLRLHCVEMQRVMQRYYCMVDGVVENFGTPGGVAAPMDVVFELLDEGAASNTPATVLYDSAAAVGALGAIASTPATCAFVIANAVSLFGSIASVSVTRAGTIWIVSTLPSGSLQTRLVGISGQGVDCEATYGTSTGTPGRVTFFSGRVPVAGERVAVMYRASQRSVARLEDAASVAAEAAGGAPGTCRWLGKVLQPVARSSADCESAAQAILAFATSPTAAVAGTYACVKPASDIWPGDVLAITSAGVTSNLLVRSVAVQDGATGLKYEMKFANDWATEWADGMGLRLSESIAADAVLPSSAATASGEVLANLQQLTVTSLSATTLTLDTGLSPPTGGGFEVRRTDEQFGVGVDAADLVLRSPVRNFSVPRAAQVERFYIRMFDGSGLYSRFSSAVFVNWTV
jgi:hypothetical protein